MKKTAICLLAIFLSSALLTSCDDDRKCGDPGKCTEGCGDRQRGYDCGGRGW